MFGRFRRQPKARVKCAVAYTPDGGRHVLRWLSHVDFNSWVESENATPFVYADDHYEGVTYLLSVASIVTVGTEFCRVRTA